MDCALGVNNVPFVPNAGGRACILASLTLRILDSRDEIFLNAILVLEHPVDDQGLNRNNKAITLLG